MNTALRSIVLAALLPLAACGGGGDSQVGETAKTVATTQGEPYPFVGQAESTGIQNRAGEPMNVNVTFVITATLHGHASARVAFTYYVTNSPSAVTENIPLAAGVPTPVQRTYRVPVPNGERLDVQSLVVIDSGVGSVEWSGSSVTFTTP